MKVKSKDSVMNRAVQKRVLTRDRAYPNAKVATNMKIAHVIVKALENPGYKWRTVQGISRETGVDRAKVVRVLEKLGEKVVRSSVPSTTGEALFTTRDYYRRSETILGRIGAILRNRAA